MPAEALPVDPGAALTRDPRVAAVDGGFVVVWLESSGATLWIEHDHALADTLRKAPGFYD